MCDCGGVVNVKSKRCRHMKQHLETAGLASFDMKYQKCWLTVVRCEGGGGGGEKTFWRFNHLPISYGRPQDHKFTYSTTL